LATAEAGINRRVAIVVTREILRNIIEVLLLLPKAGAVIEVAK
jgi:hypothetical protein